MIGVGGVTHKHYPETKGMKITSGEHVKKGTILTREGNRWKAGLNVGGKATLYALCDGVLYFSTKKGTYRTTKRYTYINIKSGSSR